MATAAEAINLLNDLLKKDPDSINELFFHRVPCNQETANHPTVQVSGGAMTTLGVLGLINGIFGITDQGYGYIAMVLDDDNKITEFILMN